MSSDWTALLVVLAFPVMWGGTCWIIGRMGWGRLAARYRTEAAGTGRAFRFVSGSIGLANYNGALTVHVEAGGLRLAVLPLSRPGHPPLLIPWGEITEIRPRKVLWQTLFALDVGTPHVATVTLPERVVAAIREAASAG